jgi:hypothetical protein
LVNWADTLANDYHLINMMIGTFVKWVLEDVFKECSDDMEELQLSRKLVQKEVCSRAQNEYKARLKLDT